MAVKLMVTPDFGLWYSQILAPSLQQGDLYPPLWENPVLRGEKGGGVTLFSWSKDLWTDDPILHNT